MANTPLLTSGPVDALNDEGKGIVDRGTHLKNSLQHDNK